MPILALLVVVGLPGLALAGKLLARMGRLPQSATPAQRSLWTDLGYVLLAPITETFSKGLTTLAFAGCALLAGNSVGPKLLEGFGPVAKQPYWLIVAEMLVLSDFIYYWTHRWAHSVPWLWRLHAVHHSTRHLRWTSALRAHPAELYVHLVNALPLFLLGFPVDALVPMAPFVTLYAFVIHMPVDVSLRRVSYVVNTPVFHGVHHALDIRDGTKNYAGLFPVFDALFGTYHLPERFPSEVGIDDAHMPETLREQLAYPFRHDGVEADVKDLTPQPLETMQRA